MMMNGEINVREMIDHTLLKPDATEEQIMQLCEEAKINGFHSVCVHPYWIPVAKRELEGSKVAICTVVGFPLGLNTKEAKGFEAACAIQAGATEIDMVMNIGEAKSACWSAVEEDIQEVVVKSKGTLVKVILETALLTEDEIVKACLCAKRAGAHFVKTSTGFGPGGATITSVRRMRETVGDDLGVKASGGIKDAKLAYQMIEAGANRLGTSSGIQIMQGERGIRDY